MSRSIKIAIIDSGIENIDGKEIFFNKSFIDNNPKDTCGHGTLCFNTISKDLKCAKFAILKVLNDEGYSNSNILINSLRCILDLDVNIINMSISILDNCQDQSTLSEINKICNMIYNQKKILICSLRNATPILSIPACYDAVLGVNGTILNSNNLYWFNKSKVIQAVADSEPRVIRGINNKRYFFKGNSKATALMTAIVAKKIIKMNFDYTMPEMCNILHKEASKNEWQEIDIRKNEKEYFDSNIAHEKCIQLDYVDDIKQIFITKFGADSEYYRNFLDYKTYINIRNMDIYFDLIDIIEKKLNVKINYDNIRCYDFYNIYALCKAIKDRWEIANELLP